MNFNHVCLSAAVGGWMCACERVVTVLCQRMCQWGHSGESNKRQRNEPPAALPLSEHTYRHPSICPALRLASHREADGSTLDPALSPLSLHLSSLPSRLRLSAICSILPTFSLPYLVFEFDFSSLLGKESKLVSYSILALLKYRRGKHFVRI